MKTIYTVDGREIFVDDEDFEFLKRFRWRVHCDYTANNKRRPMTNIKNKAVGPQHLVYGYVGVGKVIDHIDRDPFNNQKGNLRAVSALKNAWNRSKSKKGNPTSKFTGVSWVKKLGKYEVQIETNKKRYFLGRFDNELDAAHAYDKKAKELRGSFAVLNFPDEV